MRAAHVLRDVLARRGSDGVLAHPPPTAAPRAGVAQCTCSDHALATTGGKLEVERLLKYTDCLRILDLAVDLAA